MLSGSSSSELLDTLRSLSDHREENMSHNDHLPQKGTPMPTSEKDTVVSVDSVEDADESPKTNFAAKAVSSVTKFVTDHPLLVWGGVAVVAGAVAIALAPKDKTVEDLEADSVDISTADENDNNVTTITEPAPEETSSTEE
nr:MAG TPA: protein of unknown function (DUF883) [Caudoviricetes sp.]